MPPPFPWGRVVLSATHVRDYLLPQRMCPKPYRVHGIPSGVHMRCTCASTGDRIFLGWNWLYLDLEL
eukprot:1681536-Prorocentrum_lima.AAC.1